MFFLSLLLLISAHIACDAPIGSPAERRSRNESEALRQAREAAEAYTISNDSNFARGQLRQVLAYYENTQGEPWNFTVTPPELLKQLSLPAKTYFGKIQSIAREYFLKKPRDRKLGGSRFTKKGQNFLSQAAGML